jgi:hypothetical protein
MTDSQMWTIIGTIAVMFLGGFSGFYALLRSEIRVLEVRIDSVDGKIGTAKTDLEGKIASAKTDLEGKLESFRKDILTEMRIHVAEHHKP